MNKLKPCPFCGEGSHMGVFGDEYIGDHKSPHYSVSCECCCGESGSASTRECAIEKWNTRATPVWQPIETAPKDGTILILKADVPHLIRIGYYLDGGFHSIPQGSMVNDQPTHWMPLPDAP